MFIFSHISGTILSWMMQIFNNNYVIVISLFAIIVKLVTTPVNMAGNKLSARYKRLKPQIREIEERGGTNAEQVEKELLALYEENGVKTRDFLAGPVSYILNMVILLGFVRAIYEPLTYVVHLSAEEISALASLYNVGSQSSIISAFLQSPMFANGIISEESYRALYEFAMGMTKTGYDLSQVPTAHYLLFLPLITIGLYVIKEGFSIFRQWYFTKKENKKMELDVEKTNAEFTKTKTFSVTSLSLSLLSIALIAVCTFTLPAAMCIYWCTGAMIGLGLNISSFFKKNFKLKKDGVKSDE